MGNDLTASYNAYVQKYPLYSKEAIVDMMVEDGVISPDIAKKVKSGISLFLLQEPNFKSKVEEDFSCAQTLGATFSKTTQKSTSVPPTNFNRTIENTFQSDTQGDCWLLSDINAMRLTPWGRQTIHDALVPDDKGGIKVKLPGSPLPQKNFYISPQEIANAKASGHYSTGDDDMIALELATEKLSKQMVAKGIARRVDDFDEVIGYPSYHTNIEINKDKIDNKYLSISYLLTGRERVEVDFLEHGKKAGNILKYIAQNPQKVAGVCTFNHFKDLFGARDKNDPVHGNHAYAIKKIIYGKEAVVIDPYHSDKTITIPWEKFVEDLETVYIATDSNDTHKKLKTLLPPNHDKIRQEQYEEKQEELKQIEKEQLARTTKLKNDKINIETQEILSHLKTLKDDIKSNNERITPNIYLNYDAYKTAMTKVNKDNVIKVLENYPNLISDLDAYKSGWGRGNDKKELIEPIIKALVERATETGIDAKKIKNFRKNCMKELDAMFYTDINVINTEVKNMLKTINNI